MLVHMLLSRAIHATRVSTCQFQVHRLQHSAPIARLDHIQLLWVLQSLARATTALQEHTVLVRAQRFALIAKLLNSVLILEQYHVCNALLEHIVVPLGQLLQLRALAAGLAHSALLVQCGRRIARIVHMICILVQIILISFLSCLMIAMPGFAIVATTRIDLQQAVQHAAYVL